MNSSVELKRQQIQALANPLFVAFYIEKNFPCKKLTKIASQRSEELREKFLIDCSAYEPEMLVFVDETGCDRRSAMRRFGYSLRGLLMNRMC